MTSKKTRPSNLPVALGQEIELSFEDLLSNGQAVGRLRGMAIFVFGPLPDERARVRVTTVKQKYAVAELLEILETAETRAEPFCPVFGTCGGCQVQHLKYEAELHWKRSVVENALRRIGGIADVQVSATIGIAVPREYRNKMSLIVDHRNDSTGFGFYKQRSHDVVPIDHCPIVQPALNRLIGALIDVRRDSTTAPAFQAARHVVSRTSLRSRQNIVAITTPEPDAAVASLSQTLKERLPSTAGIVESFGLHNDNAILGRRVRVVAGRDSIEEVVGSLRFKISPRSFFQVNIEILERIFEALKSLATGTREIIDLYCGSGAFALFFASLGCTVFGVEENAIAVDEARENALANSLAERVQFRRGRVEDVVTEPAIRKRLQSAGAVFLDPPRRGTDARVLTAIAEARVASVWYLSCDPATLARDLKLLLPKGYRLSGVQPFDMFPQTGHIESLAVVSRVEK